MEEHSTRVQPIAVPVWLCLKPALSPPFIVTPKCRKKTNHLPQFIQKMEAENMNPAVIETFQHSYAKVRNGADGMTVGRKE